MTLSETINLVQQAIDDFKICRQPGSLYNPVEYALACGGKRLRPVLCLLAYGMYKDLNEVVSKDKIVRTALAYEVYHNFTLLHDDLMDNAEMRRGRQTVHRKWDANTAILSGDAMLSLSFQMLLQTVDDQHLRQMTEHFVEMTLLIDEGQQYDMDFENRNDVTEEEYLEMIRLKTSVLLAYALQGGAIMADAPLQDLKEIFAFGEKLGLAFQLQDDYLDCFGNPEKFGKAVGGDILCGKKTFMQINALKGATESQRAELEHWFATNPEDDFGRQTKIEAVKAIYKEVGVHRLAQERIEQYTIQATEHLANVEVCDEKKVALREFAEILMKRNK